MRLPLVRKKKNMVIQICKISAKAKVVILILHRKVRKKNDYK